MSEPMIRSDFVHYVYAAELIELAKEDHKKNTVLKYKKFGNLLHECLGVVSRCCPSADDDRSNPSTPEVPKESDISQYTDDTDRRNSDISSFDGEGCSKSATEKILISMNSHCRTDPNDAICKDSAQIIQDPVIIATESKEKTPGKIDKATELRNSVTKVNNFKTSVFNCCNSNEKCKGIYIFVYIYIYNAYFHSFYNMHIDVQKHMYLCIIVYV